MQNMQYYPQHANNGSTFDDHKNFRYEILQQDLETPEGAVIKLTAL
jgi:hypothetical protein